MSEGVFDTIALNLMTEALDEACHAIKLCKGVCTDEEEATMARAVVEALNSGKCDKHQLVAAAVLAADAEASADQGLPSH